MSATTSQLSAIQRADQEHHIHPFSNLRELNREKGSRVIVRGQGVWLEDEAGERILDGMAGLWCVNAGHGRAELAEVAAEQMNELAYYNCFFKTTHPSAALLAQDLCGLSPDFSHAFFTCSGSEAIDSMLRILWRYWQLRGEPQRRIVISRKRAYHGSTVAGAALGGMGAMQKQTGGDQGDYAHIDPPYWYELGGDSDPEEFGRLMAAQLEQKISALGPKNIAAFVGEPIQGAGGVIIPPASYWPEIERICDEHGILLVADEVICGFGRIGHWFGHQHFGFTPNLLTFAKGVTSGYQPLGGVMLDRGVAEVLTSEGTEFAHGFTYSGHPVACRVARENLRILDDERLIDRARDDIGPYLQKQWFELADHPLVGEARMVGMIGALELVKNKASRERFDDQGSAGQRCRDFCLANNLVMRAVGDSMIVSPPLVLSETDADELIKRVTTCLDLTAKSLS